MFGLIKYGNGVDPSTSQTITQEILDKYHDKASHRIHDNLLILNWLKCSEKGMVLVGCHVICKTTVHCRCNGLTEQFKGPQIYNIY